MSKIQPYFLGLTWLPKLGPIRALSSIYPLRKKPRVAKGHELPGGVRRHAPRKFFEMYMRGDAIWCILRNVIVCTAFVASGWFFRYSYFYTVMITLFWVGKLGVFFFFLGGGASFYPSNTLDRAQSIQSIYQGLMCIHGLNESQQGLE